MNDDYEYESPIRAGIDCGEIALEQVKAIISIVKQEENSIRELRINNVVFHVDDPDILIELTYEEIQWK